MLARAFARGEWAGAGAVALLVSTFAVLQHGTFERKYISKQSRATTLRGQYVRFIV